MWAFPAAVDQRRRRLRCASEKRQCLKRYVHHGRGVASQRGRSVAAKSMISSFAHTQARRRRPHPPRAGASSHPAAAIGRISARCSSRAAIGVGRRERNGCVSVGVLKSLPPRTDTTRAANKGPHGCTKSAVHRASFLHPSFSVTNKKEKQTKKTGGKTGFNTNGSLTQRPECARRSAKF